MTYKEILTFGAILSAWYGEHSEDKTKFAYAAKKVLERIVKVQDKYKESIEDIDINNCAVDKDKVILRDDKGGFRFTQEGQKKRNREVKALFEDGTAEVEPYSVQDYPEELKELELIEVLMPLRTLAIVENNENTKT